MNKRLSACDLRAAEALPQAFESDQAEVDQTTLHLDVFELDESCLCENGVRFRVVGMEERDGLFPAVLDIEIEDVGRILHIEASFRLQPGERCRLYMVHYDTFAVRFLSDPLPDAAVGCDLRIDLMMNRYEGRLYNKRLKKRIGGWEPDWELRLAEARRAVQIAVAQTRAKRRHVPPYRV